MKTYSMLKASAAPLALGLSLVATPAFAQDAAAEDEAPAKDIVVTGTLVRNPNLVQANPVNATTADQIELKQSNVAEEVLREIPGVVANIGSAVNNGNGGSSYVDLRGLGSNRNIVLLDGNRIVPADLAGRVDLNNIPLALISRVDAQTGAAVTTYGADAITGVVNFVTRKDFAGLDLSLGEQITEKGDGNYLRADLTLGANFDDGRGNAVLSLGYQESDPVYQGDRDFSTFGIDSFSGTLGGSGTTVPSRITGTRPLVAGVPSTAIDPLGSGNGGTRQVNSLGQAVGSFAFFNFNPYNIFQTPFKRYNIFAQANYKVSDSVEVYTRGMFSKNTIDTIIAPSGSFGGSVTMNLNNPYMPSTLRDQFCAFNTSGAGAYTPRFTPAECAAAATATGPADPNYRTVTFNLARRAVEVGPRISNYTSTVFDYRVGAKGDISSHVNWDVTAAYGESEKVQAIKNYTLQSRWRQGLLANNTTTCQVTTNNCVPVNPFGAVGSITPGMADFLSEDSTTTVRTSLGQVRGILSGDLGFASPGASTPIGFALGAEYRKYTAQQSSDLLAKTPGELGGAGGAAPDIQGGYNVWEGYGEMVVPLVEDAPMAKSLTVEGGARYSKYKVDGGGQTDTWTWKVAGSWEPVDGVKLRANYARAVRAPNIGELFSPLSVGLTNLALDPCAGAAPVGNTNLTNICLAQGAPLGTIGSILNPTAAQANITSGGNLNLQPEKAKTWTVGLVLQPAALSGFSMSIDYYNIKVTDVVGAQLPGDLMSACFGSITAASATNPACTVIRRNPVTGGLDGDPATTFGLYAPLSNQGTLSTRGVDFLMNYKRDLGFAKWSAGLVMNYTASSKYKATPTGLDRECVNYYSINCSFTGSIQPKWQWSLRNTMTFGDLDVSLLWRHINAVEREPQDIIDQAALGTGFIGDVVTPVGTFYVNANKIPAANYFDLTLRFNVSDNLTFTVAAQNLFNRKPPVVGSSIGSTSYNSGNTFPSTYDALGRRFAASVRLKF
ncbi:MAG: TonB-dependent receptor [Sphingomonadales bacterium]|nr:TonB-dependent receptor [Sphingomonadaceae bacterium]MBS3932696.1 TonB-dependent receptor [Sphingomonadales bacterium]